MKSKKNALQVMMILFAFLSPQAWAEIKGVAHFGYEFGGDDLLHVTYDDDSKSDIEAGDGLVMAGGIAYVVNPRFAIQTTLGFKYQTIQRADNGDAELTRFPLEAVAQFTVDKVRLSAGGTYHLNPELDGSGVLRDADLSFDDALGAVIQLDYLTEMGLIVGARYIDLDYTVKNTNIDVDAGSFGIHVTGQF